VSTPLDIESDVEPAPESSDSALVPDAEAAAEPVVHLAERPRASIDKMLELLWQLGGTDLQLTVDARPTIRVHGDLHPIVDEPVLGPDDTQRLLAELLDADRQAIFADGHEHDFSFSWRNLGRVRGNAFRQRGSIAIALRLIPREVPTMAGLGLPQALYELVRQHQGLILFTGPTGSGKSTSLAAMINQINHDRACHIITIEDPIEYVHSHARSLVNQREVGTDTASFPQALRSVLREDPDVLLVGEMRDLDSIRFALTIAETGHLVFATLHTNDTAQSLGRIVDVFPGDQQAQIRTQLAAALTGIVYQRLIPRVGGGMVAAYEVLLATTAARNLIKEGKTHQLRNVLVTGQRDGMITLEQSLNALIRDGVISYESAESRSLYPKELERARPLMAGMPGAPHAAAAGSVPTGAATPAGSPSTAVPAGAAGPAWNGARS
jgi:twitching motility protein PilT